MYLINGLGAPITTLELSPANLYRLAQGYVAGSTPTFVTELRPYNLRSGAAPGAPAAVVAALDYWFRPEEGGSMQHAAGWGSTGRIWVRFSDPSDQSGVRRDGALRAAVRRAEASLGSDVRLLLPGESAPAAAAPTPPPEQPTVARSAPTPRVSTDGGRRETPTAATQTPPAPPKPAGFFDTTTILVLIAAASGLGYLYYARKKTSRA